MDLISITGALQSIPAGMQTRMQQAASTLIGSVTKIPKAWIDSKAQSIADRADASRSLQKTLIEASKKHIKTDNDLIDATIDAYLPDAIRKSRNKFNVLHDSADFLRSETGDNNFDANESDTKLIDEDWLNLFSRQAEDASSDRMRMLLGRILAGEIRKPNSFSPSTLRIVAEMDHEMAQDLQKMTDLSVDNSIFVNDEWHRGELFAFASRLELYGFTTGAPDDVSQTFELNESDTISMEFDGGKLTMKCVANTEISVPVLALTKNAIQLKSLLPSPMDKISLYRNVYKCFKELESSPVFHGEIILSSGETIIL